MLLCVCPDQFRPGSAALAPTTPRFANRPFRGVIQLRVDATDLDHAVFRVQETIPLHAAGNMILLYPEWDTASHAPTSSPVELAGLEMQIDGRNVEWRRDVLNTHAFHLSVPPRAQSLSLTFDYLPSMKDAILRPRMIVIPLQHLVLYPAGWYARDIRVSPSVSLPAGLRPFTSLTLANGFSPVNSNVVFVPETLDRLIDAPVYAAAYAKQLELASPSQAPIHLDLVADAPGDLVPSTVDLAQLQALVVQTEKTFGPPPFHHYDAIVSLSDELSPGGGTEHLDEGENNLPANYLSAPAKQLNNRDLIAHELVHAWNGRFRQPEGLWSPDFNRPTDPSMLWVYEGQTEFWGRILAARAGMRTLPQTLDQLALDASRVANRPGRAWKTLADDTLDPLYMIHQSIQWRDWQRREDYYPEGVLLWLDVDSHLRELTHGTIGLDNFAHTFFATHGKVDVISLYSFNDICRTLNALAPEDWKGFLNKHLWTHDTTEAMAGLARAGWRLAYTRTPSDTFLQDEAEADTVNLDTSLGLQLDPRGLVRSVVWNGPAFRAGLAPGKHITSVNGQPFSSSAILRAIDSSGSTPVRLTWQENGATRNVTLPYAGSLRYPHLERIANTPDRLTSLFGAR